MFRRTFKTIPAFASIAFLLFAMASSSPANASKFTTIDFPGATSTAVYGIDTTGAMVGVYVDAGNVNHGFMLKKGVFTTIDFPGATLSVAAGINDKNKIVGQYNDSAGLGNGFSLSQGKFHKLDFPSYQTYPTAIAKTGEVVGFCIDSQLKYHGCVDNRGFTLLDVPGAPNTVALGVNPSQGNIVGGFSVKGYNFKHGFLYSNGKFTNIDFPGAAATVAFGINDSGEVVGNYSLPKSTKSHGFVMISGVFKRADVPASLSTFPNNLNNKGQVVGWYVDKNKSQHGYLMTGSVR